MSVTDEVERLKVELAEAKAANVALVTGQDALRGALTDLLRCNESLMPGVRYIAVQDYALLNEAPLRARLALTQATRTKESHGKEA